MAKKRKAWMISPQKKPKTTLSESLKAEGIVGVLVDETNHTWGPSVLEFSAVGTAVKAIRADHQIPRPTLVLTVGD